MFRPAQLSSLLVITLVASCLFQGCRSEEPAPRVEQPPLPTPSRIFLITIDTLRADHLGAYGYPRETSPNIDRLAEEGVLFRRAIAQWPKTTPSFGAIFTGQYPQTNGMTHRAARGLYDSFLTMAEMLQDAGYFTAAVISNPVLRKSLGWDQGFDKYWQSWRTDEDLGSDAARYREVINAQRVNSMAPYLLERVAAHDRFFVWIHYSDPHEPYSPPTMVHPNVAIWLGNRYLQTVAANGYRVFIDLELEPGETTLQFTRPRGESNTGPQLIFRQVQIRHEQSVETGRAGTRWQVGQYSVRRCRP